MACTSLTREIFLTKMARLHGTIYQPDRQSRFYLTLALLPKASRYTVIYGYIASNTSNNVDILDLSTNMRVGQIREVASPRYISVVDQGKAYVSEQLDPGKVKVLDLQSTDCVRFHRRRLQT